MSCRQMRKVIGENKLPTPENSDDDYEPPCAKKSTFSYAGLEVSDSDHENRPSGSTEEEPEVAPATSSSRTKKNNRKKRKNKERKNSQEKGQYGPVDEVQQAVAEVNQLLGSLQHQPEPCASGDVITTDSIMTVESKHLNSAYEIKRKFGGADEEPKKRGRQSVAHLFKKAVIVPMDKYTNVFKRRGLSMSRNRFEDGVWYYTYDHSVEYQINQQGYLNIHMYMAQRNPLAIDTNWLKYMGQGQAHFHVEMLLQCADSFFIAEEYTSARSLLEQSVAYLLYVAHPSFNVADPATRLEYEYIENRPFHVAIMKYLYLMTNTACHRTALELAKMLMNLDPSDPMAIILIIDTLALRAREHEWLIKAIDKWSKEKNSNLLYNIQYSNALAHFHVLTKKKGDISKATELLEDAILNFPNVVLDILTCASQRVVENLKVHPFFEKYSKTTSPLKETTLLYAKLVWGKWSEPDVLGWLTKTVVQLTEKYDNMPHYRQRAEEAIRFRVGLFGEELPEEVMRHLSIIRPMAQLLCEHTINLEEWYRTTDPVPAEPTINRYNYELTAPWQPGRPYRIMYDLLGTINPNFDPLAPMDSDYDDSD